MPQIRTARPLGTALRRAAGRAVAMLLILLALLPAAAQAQGRTLRLSEPFEADRLGREELRALQAALALEGDYEALLDGSWGRGSQDALVAHVRRTTGGSGPTWRDVRALVRAYADERRLGGWRPVWHDAGQVWHLRPDGLLADRSTAREERYATEDGGLLVIAQTNTFRPDALHEDFAADARPGSDPYRLDGGDLMVTAAEMRGGRFAYVRSDREGGGAGWTTHIVIADAANRARQRLIASSFSRRRQDDIAIPPNTVLAALVDSAPSRPEAVAPPPRDGGTAPVEEVLGTILTDALTRLLDGEDAREVEPDRSGDDGPPSGADRLRALDREARRARGFDDGYVGALTGTYVNTTDILTADSLEGRCDGAVVLERGTPVTLVTRDAELGLAVYAAPGRSDSWIPISLGVPRGGLAVTAASRGGRDGLRSREGSVRTGRDTAGLDLSFDLDRGEAGAALLGPDLALIGIWTGERGRRAGGAAISAAEMVAFLDAARIPFGTPAQRLRPDDDLARTVGPALVRLRCDPR